MNKLTDWVKRNQVAVFFIITLAISWGSGFPWSAALKQDQFRGSPLTFVKACTPGLVGISIPTVTNAQPEQGSSKAFRFAFCVLRPMSALDCLANLPLCEHFPLSRAAISLLTISAGPVAFVIASDYSRISSVRNYLAWLIQFWGEWGWSFMALAFPALLLISFIFNSIINRQPIPSYFFPDISLTLTGLVIGKLLYQLFFFEAAEKEAGWRGFALSRLKNSHQPVDRSFSHRFLLGVLSPHPLSVAGIVMIFFNRMWKKRPSGHPALDGSKSILIKS